MVALPRQLVITRLAPAPPVSCLSDETSGKHSRLPLRVFDPATGDLEELSRGLYADKRAPLAHAGDAGGPGPHEGVEDHLGVRLRTSDTTP
jgi:hypothetical protein